MKKNIFNILKIFISLISLLLIIFLIKTINELNILPTKYYWPLITIIIFLYTISLTFALIKKRILNIISIIINIIIIIISIIGIKYGKQTIEFIKNSFNNNNETTIYNVIVLNESNYKDLKELNNKNIGYFKTNEQEYLDLLNNEINPILKEFETPFSLYDNLITKKVDAIILNEGYLSLLEEYIEIDIRVIYSFEIKQEEQEINEYSELRNINILISGSDSRSGIISSKSGTDVNMIVTINIDTNTILLTSIPRDYYVQLDGTYGIKDKLTHSGIYGVEKTKKTLENLFDIEIDYTLKVGFRSVIDIVDLIGGIDIVSDQEFISHCRDGGAERTYVKKGLNHFTGPQALSYARERYAYTEGDRHRILNQQQVLEAIMNKIFNDKSLLLKYEELLEIFQNLYITDIPSGYIQSFIKKQLNDMNKWTIIKQSVNGTGASRETYSMPGQKLYVMIPDMETVNIATNKIKEIKNNNLDKKIK